jgi:hypothetical protein
MKGHAGGHKHGECNPHEKLYLLIIQLLKNMPENGCRSTGRLLLQTTTMETRSPGHFSRNCMI